MRKYPYIKLYLSVSNIYIALSINIPFLEQDLIFIPKPVVSFVNERVIEFLPCDCHSLFESQSVGCLTKVISLKGLQN